MDNFITLFEAIMAQAHEDAKNEAFHVRYEGYEYNAREASEFIDAMKRAVSK